MLSRLEQEIELIKRHATILKFVVEKAPIGIMKLSELSGYPQHKVRYSLRVLEHQNLIKPSSEGAVATSKARKFIKFLPGKIKQLSRRLENLGLSFEKEGFL